MPAAERRGAHVIVVTGSESTGKTTLAGDLARHYATTWVPEFARAYLDETMATTGQPLDASDVEPIARGHIVSADAGIARARRLVVLDTDLVSTVVYSQHYYGDCPAWIERAARERLGDLYLLCAIDAPWVADSARDRPHEREHMHGLFVAALDTLGARYVTLRGSWAERRAAAIAAVDTCVVRHSEGSGS